MYTYFRGWSWVTVDCNKLPVFSNTHINNVSAKKSSICRMKTMLSHKFKALLLCHIFMHKKEKSRYDTQRIQEFDHKYMLFTGWLPEAAAFSSPRSQFFTIQTNSKLVNNLFIFFQALKRKETHGKKLTQTLLWPWLEIGKSGPC